jgi:hypothetical protein
MARYFFKLNLLGYLILLGMPSLPVHAQAVAQLNTQLNAQLNTQFNDDQIRRYAGAASAIEKKRDDVWRRAKAYEGWNSLTNKAEAQGVTVCGLKKSEQPPVIQTLCGELFDFSEQEIRRNGFSSNRDFNQITQAQKQNNQLQKRIQAEIIELNSPKK